MKLSTNVSHQQVLLLSFAVLLSIVSVIFGENVNIEHDGFFTWEEHTDDPNHRGSRRRLIDNGRRFLTTDAPLMESCDAEPSPCGPESACTQVNATSYICENEFAIGCVGGCSEFSSCQLNSRGFYYCKCDDGYYQPQRFMGCRLKTQ
jgi:hypothetical protein